MASRRERVARGEIEALTPAEVATASSAHGVDTEEQRAVAVARTRAVLIYLRSALAALTVAGAYNPTHSDTHAYPTLDAADAATRRFDDWAGNKMHRFYALINYITGTLGLPSDMARLEIARELSADGGVENLTVSASNKRPSPPARAELLQDQLRAILDALEEEVTARAVL